MGARAHMPMFAHALCLYKGRSLASHTLQSLKEKAVVERAWSRDRCGGGKTLVDGLYYTGMSGMQICVSPSSGASQKKVCTYQCIATPGIYYP